MTRIYVVLKSLPISMLKSQLPITRRRPHLSVSFTFQLSPTMVHHPTPIFGTKERPATHLALKPRAWLTREKLDRCSVHVHLVNQVGQPSWSTRPLRAITHSHLKSPSWPTTKALLRSPQAQLHISEDTWRQSDISSNKTRPVLR